MNAREETLVGILTLIIGALILFAYATWTVNGIESGAKDYRECQTYVNGEQLGIEGGYLCNDGRILR